MQSPEQTFRTSADVPGWRDGFDDESKVSLKEDTAIARGNVNMILPSFKVYPIKDSRINPELPRTSGIADLAAGDSERYRTLMDFVLPSATASIDSIKLHLNDYKVLNSAWNQTLNLHLVNGGSFDENSVSWTNRSSAQKWANAGGDFNPAIIDHYSAAGDLSGKWINFTLRGQGADNSLNSLTWGNTISLMLKASEADNDKVRSDWFSSKEGDISTSPYIEIIPSMVKGTLASMPINLPQSAASWDKFYATATRPQGTSITFSMLDASTDAPLCTGLTGSADNVSSCLSGKTSVKLKAEFSTTNPAVTPVLHDWKIGWAVPSLLNYSATFSQSGLPAGTRWSMAVNGAEYNTTDSSITVSKLSGTVSYSYIPPVSASAGTRYVCAASCSGSISSPAEITASYKTQYRLTMSSSPAGGGVVSPSSGSWHDAGSSVQISASPSSGYAFSSWTGSGTGSYTGVNNPATVRMNAPVSEAANFNNPIDYIAFSTSGLPDGTKWSVYVKYKAYTTTAPNSISVSGLSGSARYFYSYVILSGRSIYLCVSGCSGSAAPPASISASYRKLF